MQLHRAVKGSAVGVQGPQQTFEMWGGGESSIWRQRPAAWVQGHKDTAPCVGQSKAEAESGTDRAPTNSNGTAGAEDDEVGWAGLGSRVGVERLNPGPLTPETLAGKVDTREWAV